YHDVGKLKQPECFTENQTDYNVHDELTPELSADIIRSHATDGYNFLMSAHLPEEIANVAIEHHGTLPIKYFYNKALKLAGEDLGTKDYSYLGPTPSTKIAAIVMIADASEAAVRSLSDRSAEYVERIVRGIIEERMDLDQFDECDITLKDLATIKETLVVALSGVHHHRVKYPSIRFNRAKETVAEKEDSSK
ncbi:MAG: HD domain-containing protein, partial [Clostridiales bacterium]|nr:HD domain-containing protein [Clostridiales bacterium]